MRTLARATWLLSILLLAPSVGSTITIDNDITGDGAYSVDVADGGDTRVGYVDPIGNDFSTDVIFDYFHYIDVGAPGGAVRLANTTISSSATLSGQDQVTSSGSFAGENGTISWTATGGSTAEVTPTWSASPFQAISPLGEHDLFSTSMRTLNRSLTMN